MQLAIPQADLTSDHTRITNSTGKEVAFYFAAFFFANGDGTLPALIATQRLRAASLIAFRPAALIFRFFRVTFLAEAGFTQSGTFGAL